ncbi:CAP domain-containing protein [Clostridium botulinum]|uniref:Serine protease n=1 Tax=Clostridium botulinum TaxID=1491 RepID=A0A6B4JIT7_CLOBO|nr:CAP domain-containing protein [Clostridium botulinum]EES48887.1 SCP-like extracellular protein [Clostridium botulinum E1 str. 'BoNT E Beluga']MBY6760610.1 serine protease [Clostridium botulinum]MBY6919517.1 serine protease [Clostridium botulinum]MCR1130396.1 CAP domain-containing protein [Clostridium botulinum]NFH69002.1 serine protease [Clostridium botulinum]
MKKAFLRRILGGVVAVATITSLSPLGVSAAGKNNTNNNCATTQCWSKVYGTWFCLGSNGQIQIGNQTTNNNPGCNLQFGWVTCPTQPNKPGDNNGSDNTIVPEVPGDNNGSNDTTVPEVPGNNNRPNDTTVPEVPGDNNGSDNTIVPEVPGDNNGSGNTTVPETPGDNNESENTSKPDNNGNNGTVKPEQPGDTEENLPPTSGDSVNVNGLSKLPEKYSISVQSSAENKILQLMNEKRVQAGLKPLTMDNTLLQVARYKSNHMIQYNYFDHTNPDGTKWVNWLQTIGYKYNTTGENIAYNTYDPVELFNQWWNSQGHRENMMNPSYTKVGVGVVYDKDNNKYMGTQTFSN